jgi:predicted RNase H-like nuclease (RuvC/YqgF family)
MQGARWGWIAFIAAIGILFAASSHDQTSSHKVTALLRQEMKTIAEDRDEAQQSLKDTRQHLEETLTYSQTLDETLLQQLRELKELRAEREKLRKELSLVNLDRNQLQQSIASLQQERSQTKRSVEQLRQGLHQLLSQADNVAQGLSSPAPGFAQISFEADPKSAHIVKPAKKPVLPEAGVYYADEPLNKNQ